MFHLRGALAPFSLLLVCLGVPVQALGEKTAQETSFSFEKLDRTYTSFVEELAPIEVSSLKIVLRSPEHSMTLESHYAELVALGSSEYEAVIGFRFLGQGVLDADVTVGLVESQLQDELVLPLQSLRLAGRVQIDSAVEGYTITLLESHQETADVSIESKLAGRLVPLCKQLALVLVNLGCDVLEEALSVVRVPIPEPGTTFFLSRAELSPDEAKHLDAYLEAGAGPAV